MVVSLWQSPIAPVLLVKILMGFLMLSPIVFKIYLMKIMSIKHIEIDKYSDSVLEKVTAGWDLDFHEMGMLLE